MISNLSKAISRLFWVLLLVATFVPMRSLAADPTDLGKITIQVTDENGVNLAGNWYLHAGTAIGNTVIRNGTKGEVFNSPAGSYFLEVRNLKAHPFYPQMLDIGGSIEFKVQYFTTEDQKANATIAPVVVEPAVVDTVPAEDMPASTVDTPAPSTSAPAVVTPKPNPHIKLNIIRPVAEDAPAQDTASSADQGYSLAVTGPEGLLGALSLFSLASGLWIVKRKNS